MERVGLPTVHICAITPVALMVGSNRIITATKIVNPVGNAELDPREERKLRRAIVEKALEALGTDVHEQTLFS
jgi:betaine reductase